MNVVGLTLYWPSHKIILRVWFSYFALSWSDNPWRLVSHSFHLRRRTLWIIFCSCLNFLEYTGVDQAGTGGRRLLRSATGGGEKCLAPSVFRQALRWVKAC